MTTLTPSMKRTNKVRVLRGVEYLDATMPNWWQVLDIDKLDLASPCGCVIGQLVSDVKNTADHRADYWTVIDNAQRPKACYQGTAVAQLTMSHRQAIQRGLQVDDRRHASVHGEMTDFAQLQSVWVEVVKARRQGN